IAYLRTLKPMKKATPPLKTWAPFMRSLGTPLFLKVFGRFSNSPPQAPKSGIDRGRYLVEHVSLCGDCHTPRTFLRATKRSLYHAGDSKNKGDFGKAVTNMTPDKEPGIKDCKREDTMEVLIYGSNSDLANVQGLMAEVVEHGYKNMVQQDSLA